MSQSKFRRVFSQDFRHGTVQPMSAGEGASALARELGVLRKSLYEWKDKYAENGLPGLARQAGRAARAMPGVVPIVEPAVASRGELLRARAHIEELELDFFEHALRRIKALGARSKSKNSANSSPIDPGKAV